MAYRIEYGPPVKKPASPVLRRFRFQLLTASLLFLFVLSVRLLWPAGTAKLREVLLPAEPSWTAQAAQDMVEQVRQGENLGDAVTAFCREVLNHAEFPR